MEEEVYSEESFFSEGRIKRASRLSEGEYREQELEILVQLMDKRRSVYFK